MLVVDEIGKTYSGTGMDTNVIGYRGVRDGEDLTKPRIHVIAALSLAEASHGNAIGVGLADFITRRLRDAIDEQKTFLNTFTTGHMGRAKIPATFANDEELITTIARRYGERRWLFIPNTLHLDTLYASEDLAEELAAHPLCTIDAEADRLEVHAPAGINSHSMGIEPNGLRQTHARCETQRSRRRQLTWRLCAFA